MDKFVVVETIYLIVRVIIVTMNFLLSMHFISKFEIDCAVLILASSILIYFVGR